MAQRLFPFKRGTFKFGSPFGNRPGGFHAGLDFAADDGTPFYACQSGTVQFIGAAGGYGQWIVIDSNDAQGGGCVEYGHMWNASATGLRVGSRVEAGQLIGYVGSNGQSTGPHLHISVWPRGYGSGSKIDPAAWLNSATYLGDALAPAPAIPEGKPVTLFGIDVSNHQGNFDFAAAKREGFSFATHKVTESDNYKDPYWPRARDQMREHFAGRFGGYHFYRRNADVNRQADLLLAHIGDPSIPVQLDFEDTAGGGTVDNMFAMIRAIEARGMRVFANYVPRWFWESRMASRSMLGSPPLWSSSYGSNPTGFASAIYPGDNGVGWQSYGDVDVAIWQFGEHGKVAGQSIDVNAFRGTDSQLAALFGGQPQEEEMDFASFKAYMDNVVSDVKDIRQQLTGGRDRDQYPGWPQLGDKTVVDAVADLRDRVAKLEDK